jgi:hypothetical protein
VRPYAKLPAKKPEAFWLGVCAMRKLHTSIRGAAETIFAELSIFFKSNGRKPEEKPTEKQAKRDFNSLLHGRHDGKRKIIDETFKDTAQFKETEEGNFKELRVKMPQIRAFLAKFL